MVNKNMEIYFSPSSLEKLINKDDKLRKKYGTKQTDLIRRRLDELEAAANLEELTKIPWLKVHPLKHNRAGQGSVNLDGDWRFFYSETKQATAFGRAGSKSSDRS